MMFLVHQLSPPLREAEEDSLHLPSAVEVGGIAAAKLVQWPQCRRHPRLYRASTGRVGDVYAKRSPGIYRLWVVAR